MAGIATLAVRVTAQLAEFKQEFATANTTLNKFSRDVEGMSARVSRIGSAMGTAFSLTAIVGAIHQVGKLGGALVDLEAKSGISLRGLQRLKFTAEQTGGSIETLADAATKFGARVADGNKDAITSLERLGFSVAQIRAQDPGQALEDIAAAVAKIPEPMERAKVAQDLFGKSGLTILPQLTADMKSLGDEAERIGIVMSDKTVRGADDLGDSLDKLKGAGQSLLVSVLAPLTPVLNGIASAAANAAANLQKLSKSDIGVSSLNGFQGLQKFLEQFEAVTALAAPKVAAGFGQLGALQMPEPLSPDEIKRIEDSLTEPFKKAKKAVDDFNTEVAQLFARISGANVVQSARQWDAALKRTGGVTKLTRRDTEELIEVLDSVVDHYGSLEKAGVGAMKDIHTAAKALTQEARMLEPELTQTISSVQALGELFTLAGPQTIDVDLAPTLTRDSLQDFTANLAHGIAMTAPNMTDTFRDAFTNLGRDLPGLIFGAIQRGDSVISVVANGAAQQFMGIFQKAVARASSGGAAMRGGEKIAGLIGTGLASLVNGIALGQQTSSLLKGALGGAASGALAGANPLLSGPTLGASIAIGAGVGLIGGLIGAGQKKDQEREALRQSKEALKVQFGGMQKLEELARKAGFSVDRAFDAKNAQDFNRAVEDINRHITAYNNHLEGLSTATEGVNQRTAVFAENFNALIAKRDELLDSGATGAELESVTAKIAETAQRVQPEFERLGLMVRDTFAGLVRESGNAFTAIQALAPSFQTLERGVTDFGLTSTAAIDELLASFRLINDETFGPFLANIQASGQVLRGLFDAKALSPEGFQAIAADIGQSFQEIANRGGDITRALALNQPILQTLWEAQQRLGLVTDQTTQSILRQAEEQGLVGEGMKDVSERILDVLISIADVFGAKIPDALRQTKRAAQDAADGVTDALSDINVPPITVDVIFERAGEDTVEIPALAHGGIVRRPTLALVGEAGPEAVVPLSQASRFAEMDAAAGAQTFHVTINGDVDTDARAERVVQDFARVVRRGGRLRTVALQSLGVE